MILLGIPAEAVDFVQPWDRAELGSDEPVLDRAQLHGRVRVAFERVLVDLTQPSADGPHLWLGPLRQLLFGRFEPLEHKVPGEVRVNVVFEDNDDLREGRLG